MNTWLDRVDVILCRPEGALNVGACCRSLKTMGLNSLVLISAPVFDVSEVRKMSLHAWDVYQKARRFEALEDALADTVLSAGITRRRGVRRKWFSLLPEELALRASSLKTGRIALVFGNEKDGLSDEELRHCNVACHIPASPDFPSLNLSHAVQLISSALWRAASKERIARYEPISRTEIDELVQVIHDALEGTNYFKTADRLDTDRYFRDILTRAALSVREARHMEKIYRKLQYLIKPSNEDEC